MAFAITNKCTACGECLDSCPVDAIEVGEPIFVISDLCCEFEDCVVTCPENAIIPEKDLVD